MLAGQNVSKVSHYQRKEGTAKEVLDPVKIQRDIAINEKLALQKHNFQNNNPKSVPDRWNVKKTEFNIVLNQCKLLFSKKID